MLWFLAQLIVFVHTSAARFAELAGLALGAPERLAWDRERVAAFRRGDATGFSDLYRAYAGLLYARVVLPILKQPSAAEDALADTFVRAHATLHRVDVSDRSVFFWLARVARNRALDLRRHDAARRAFASKVEVGFAALHLPEPDAESRLALRDEERVTARRIETTLLRLHPRYATALRLRFVDERSRADCAREIGVTLPTFDVVLLRALRAFRRAFQEENG